MLTSGTHQGRGGNRGAAAFGGPGALGPLGLPNKKAGAGGFASGSCFSGRFAPRRRPPSAGFSTNAKRTQKARPFGLPSPAPSTARKKVVATASRSETAAPDDSDLLSRAAAPGRPCPAVARLSSCAQHRLQPSRRKGASLFPERSRDGMSSAPVKKLYRGRADGVRGDEGPGT